MPALSLFDMYFLEPEKRQPPQLFFSRLIGWDEAGETMRFLHRYWRRATQSGLWLRQTLPNPADNEINRFFAAVGHFDGAPAPQTVSRHVTIWLGQLRPERRDILVRAVNSALTSLRDMGRAQSRPAAESIERNAYIKLMCWISSLGAPILRRAGANPPKVLYEGEITRHELLFLRVLALSGCDVVYVNFNSEQSYKRADPEGSFSAPLYGAKTGTPLTHYSDGDALRLQEARAAVRRDTDKVAGVVETNTWVAEGDDFWEAALRENRFRRAAQAPRLCNLCFLCFGADQRDEYRNRLFLFREKLRQSGKGWLLLDRKIPNPTNEEIANFREVQQVKDRRGIEEAVVSRLSVAGGETAVLLARRALLALFDRQKDDNPGRFGNYAIKMACWLKRYADLLFADYRLEHQPLLLCYCPLLPAEIDLLWLLKEIAVDVLYFAPDKEAQAAFRGHALLREARIVEWPDSMRWEPFPDKEARTRVATVAYNAARELDQLLYGGTDLFRARQFPRSKPVTLKTTYDEIGILWNAEAKYRPNFQVNEGTVVVPTIFAKICGVEKG
ncbi:MAG: YceG family protein, partial [Gracilibacteraceae bacterium]|nr:YceG family protein [Gracilibacteraceae bacterium]